MLNINTTRLVDVYVFVCGFQSLFEVLHSTLAITSYQGLDEREGIEETQRWKEVRAEKEGSRFSGRTEKGENRD